MRRRGTPFVSPFVHPSGKVFPLQPFTGYQGLIGPCPFKDNSTLVTIESLSMWGTGIQGRWHFTYAGAAATGGMVLYWKKPLLENEIVSVLNDLGFDTEKAGWKIETQPDQDGDAVDESAITLDADESDLAQVYFMRSGSLIKIGASLSPKNRLAVLRTAAPAPVLLLATMPVGFALERELHKRFDHLRVHGEWFRAEEPLLTYIDKNATAHAT